MFFYLYFVIELLAIFLDSGIIPTASNVYPVSVLCSVPADRRTQAVLTGPLSLCANNSGSQRYTQASSQRLIAACSSTALSGSNSPKMELPCRSG